MVYCGKPSTGCRNCRSRHIKCDEARPHCKACIRTGRTCPGYPHPLDVMLRDRTAFQRKKSNVTKSKTTKAAKPRAASEESSPVTVSDTTPSPVTTVAKVSRLPETWGPPVPVSSLGALISKLPRDLSLPMEHTVTSLFFNSYLCLPRDPLIRIGFMELLPERYLNSRAGSPLSLGTLAISFFSASAWTGQRSLLGLAEQYFVKALSKTRLALQNGLGGNPVETLMAVLLLSVYEEFSAVKEHRVATKTHLRGAIALVNSGYITQQEDANSQILSNSIQTQVIKASTVPPAYPTVQTPDVWPLATPIPQSVSSQLTADASELVNLRQLWDNYAAQPDMGSPEELRHILSMAENLDGKLLAWEYVLPKHWIPRQATIIPESVREAGIFRNRCDCYDEMWIACTWNTYRETRIGVRKIIINCLRLLPEPDTLKIQSTISTIQQMASDICATVPYFLGSQTMSVHLNPYKVQYPEMEGHRVSPAHQETAPLLGGWFILSSLENLCSPELCLPEDQRVWVMEQLHRIWRIYTFDLQVRT
ncbi:C6 zinc finger domain protein [Aspergillus avenaceus]|uniref:C6 zinc finger domain protein n=1 Tax=Aspergillus avenaceus TaxID=36643 RepID=A0A5N6TRP3_ASPAV|nr:C6 zinc finger domain protein [Aspergillus avenaceus]